MVDLLEKRTLVYTAFSKHYAFMRQHISVYVINKDCIPLNPFQLFDYFLLDSVNRDDVRIANNNVIQKAAEEVWVFGPIANGVLAEIKLAKNLEKPIKYFRIEKSRGIIPISKDEVEFESGVEATLEDL